jgi:hypothetical protein
VNGPDVDLVAELLRHETDRPLGDGILQTRLATRQLYSPLLQSADNLLAKAARATVAADQEKADRYIARTLALPYDDQEESDTALQGAHMLVFREVTRRLEDCDENDSHWLDGAESMLEAGPDDVREHLLHVLDIVHRDYSVSRRERQRIQAAQRRHPQPRSTDGTYFRPADELLPEAERHRYVRSAVDAVAALRRAWDSPRAN